VNSAETTTGKLFGRLWGPLSDEHFEQSVELFFRRAEANGFDTRSLEGRVCLDAGSGSGRYSVALAISGARVYALDTSAEGIREARRRVNERATIVFTRGSVLALPFANETFDFVWSAGVIHHTPDMFGAIMEFRRVLRTNARLFLLVYGWRGLRWKAIKSLRPILADLGFTMVDEAMRSLGLPANNRKHFADDLLVPIQTLTRYADLESMLVESGFSEIDRWTGETFDHEASVESQIGDIKKLAAICRAIRVIARSSQEIYLAEMCVEIADLYVSACRAVIEDVRLSEAEKTQIVIGEGNHRVVATAN